MNLDFFSAAIAASFNKQIEPGDTSYFQSSLGHTRAGWKIVQLYATAEVSPSEPLNMRHFCGNMRRFYAIP